MPRLHPASEIPRFSVLAACLFAVLCCGGRLAAQGVPTVQQSQFRSQWVGEQVDQIPFGQTMSPLNALGAVVGSLQTPDQVQREVDASMANLEAKSPFAIKPSLGVGWQTSNQGSMSTNNGVTTYGTDSSPFLAPALALLYDRDHGPWNISGGYSVGYKYYSNQSYVANGTGSLRNPLSQTGLFKVALEMSRYILNALVTASSGTGYDIASASNNRQTTVGANVDMKYLVSSVSAVAAKAGYSIQNYSGSTATPNNNTASFYADTVPVYNLSDKTHLSAVLGIGQTSQALQQGTAVTGNVPTASNQNATLNYAQALAKVKYDFTAKLSGDVGLGMRYVTASGISNATTIGTKPAWAAGLAYTPTAKTSVTISTGEQGADVVPEFNMILAWQPREKTQVSVALSQSETFANSLTAQYLVNRGIMATLNQRFFSSVEFSVSGGYTMQNYINLSSNQTAGQATSQLPSNFFIANVSLIWRIRDWVNLANTVYYNTGQTVQAAGGGSTTQPQAWYSVSLNFAL